MSDRRNFQQSNRFILAFESLIMEDYKSLLGKKLTITDVKLVYAECNSEVRVELQLENENDKYRTYLQEEAPVFYPSCTSSEDIKETYENEIELDPAWEAAFRIYQAWEKQCPDFKSLPRITRENACLIKSKMDEVGFIKYED